MLSKSDEDVVNDRLKNWGLWCADHKCPGCSPIYFLMRKYGEPEPEKRERIRIDVADALLVNRAWQELPESPLRYKRAKWILVAHYAYPHLKIEVCCRRMKIHPDEYERLLKTAKYMIFNRLNQHASKRLQ